MDHTSGLNVAYALLLALYQRRKTGQGRRIDLSMYETGVSCIAPAVLEAQCGVTRPRLGTAHLWKAPHNVYPCQGTDRWITLSVATDDEWRRLKTAMGEPAWAAEARFDTVLGRCTHRRELDEQLTRWTATQDAHTLMHLLQSHGVPAGAVYTARDLVADAHLRERGYFEVFTNKHAPRVGPRVYAGRPFRIPTMPLSLHLVSALGQHNLQILRDVAKLSEAEIQELTEAGVIATSPRETAPPAPGAAWFQARNSETLYDPKYQEHIRPLVDAATPEHDA
jgi:benzylsuccinate CoA-transferase BbsF subunit